MDRSLRRALVLLVASSPGAAYAAGWSVPGDGDTIAEVLAFAVPWDTISVDPYDYAGEGPVQVTTSIIIESAVPGVPVSYPAFVVDGASLTLGDGVVSGYEFLSASYGAFSWGVYAGVLVLNGSFEGHSLALYGGYGSAIYAVDSSVTVDASEVLDASVNPALYALGYFEPVQVTLRSSALTNNQAGAVHVQDAGASYDSVVTIEDCEFSWNTTGSSGADLALYQIRTATVERTSFTGSSAAGYGGAIAVYDTDLSITEWSSFDQTSASAFASIYAEGWSAPPTVYVRDATFSNGYAWGYGDSGGSGGEIGGYYADFDVANVQSTGAIATYGGFLKADASTVLLEDAYIWYATGVLGGAVLLSGGSAGVIDGVYFCGNVADYGAAVYAYESRVELTGSYLQANEATGGGAVEVTLGDAVLRDDTFVANEGPYGAVGFLASSARVRNTIFTGSARGVYADAETTFDRTGYNLYYALTETDPVYSTLGGDVYDDPRFVRDFRPEECGSYAFLSTDSPAIDAGDPSLTDPDGTRSDIGAFGAEDEPDDTGDEPDTGDTGVVIDTGDTGDSGVVVDTADTGGLPDADGDGTPNPEDCAPGDPSIHPGAYDDPTDDVDQDCDGDAASGLARGGCGCDAPGTAPTFALVALGLALSRRRP